MSLRVKLGLLGAAIYLLCVYLLSKKMQKEGRINEKLTMIMTDDKPRIDDQPQLSMPLTERIFKPAFEKVSKAIGSVIPLSKKAQDQLSDSLRNAGIKKTPSEYFSSLATLFLLLGVAVVAFCMLVLKKNIAQTMLITLYALAMFYAMARFMLGKKVTERMSKVESELPEILDLLSVSVSAGLGFDQAMQYVVDRCEGELATELAITQREIKLGRGRNDAMRALADRCQCEPLRMFVSALTQADILGIPIANVLQVQAENVRQQHKQVIETKAAKLPVKILIPLVIFIFPNIFVVLLGPAIPKILEAFT